MRRWLNSLRSLRSHAGPCGSRFARRRWLSTTSDVQTVETRCGSSGSIAISLHNIGNFPPSTPLLIYLPPFPSAESYEFPSFLQKYPTAVIHYRWAASDPNVERDFYDTPLHWPTPIHDVSFGYSWIVKNLGPEGISRRDIFLYSSHLGASLATSLALTETHPHLRFAVRGFATYNGIYNWTMFLPDHRVHKTQSKMKDILSRIAPGSSVLQTLDNQMPGLFHRPQHLFDPFASPALLFQTPGLHIPQSFTQSREFSAGLDWLSSAMPDSEGNPLGIDLTKPPRRSRLIFPPRTSTLKIPDSLLLFSRPPPQPGRRKSRSLKPKGHTFQTQAVELAELMRKSVQRLEVKERQVWDEDFDEEDDVAEKRVRLYDVGEETGIEPNDLGQEIVSRWLDEKIR